MADKYVIATDGSVLEIKEDGTINKIGTVNDKTDNTTINRAPKTGVLRIVYDGYWILWDVKIEIFVNGQFISDHSFKNPWVKEIPIKTYPLKLKIKQSFLKFVYDIPLDRSSDYTCRLTYDRAMRWFHVAVYDESNKKIFSE